MREIKFRAINIKGEFIYGCYVTDNEDYHAIVSPLNKLEMKNTPVDSDTVGQFTGLQDKNGVDIYEDDIVDGVTYKDHSTHIGRVLYDYNGYMISTGEKSLTLSLTEKLTVIGNIHQNPELLKC